MAFFIYRYINQMKNKALSLFLTLITVFCFFLSSRGNDKFNFDYDYCVFKSGNSRLFLEFYYSFYQNQLKFIKNDNGFEAAGFFTLDIVNIVSKSSVIQKDYKVPIMVNDTAGYNKAAKLTGQINMLLDSGIYNIILKAYDFNDTSNYTKHEEELILSQFDDKKVTSSGIQLATDISKSSDQKNLFYKNTLEVIPNPSNLFGNKLSNLYYYTEFYNLKKEQLSENYSILTLITDLNGVELRSDVKNYKIKNESKVEYGQFDISQLKTGDYKFVIKLQDESLKTIVEQQKRFWIYNTDTSIEGNQIVSDGNYSLSEYVNYTEEQVNNEIEKSVYLMSDALIKKFDKLNNLDAKKRLLFEFWNQLEASPLSLSKKEYLKRVDYANKNFKNDFIEGWKTDRGRVYCIYGIYDNIERFPFEASTRAYEIWTYDRLEGGAIFVFIDLSNNMGNYVLVHSTVRNELKDENWKSRLRIR
ncbi:MAG: GWxTD domain-containing protein [Ignavibacteria bacterium]